MEILIAWTIFCILIAAWSHNWGRNGLVWFLLAALFSPLLTGVALLIAGKTVEKKAEEAAATAAMKGE